MKDQSKDPEITKQLESALNRSNHEVSDAVIKSIGEQTIANNVDNDY